MCIQYIGGYSVHWGCSLHQGLFSTLGEYHEYIGGVKYIGGYHECIGEGDIMYTLGDIMSTSGFSIEIERIYQVAPPHAS